MWQVSGHREVDRRLCSRFRVVGEQKPCGGCEWLTYLGHRGVGGKQRRLGLCGFDAALPEHSFPWSGMIDCPTAVFVIIHCVCALCWRVSERRLIGGRHSGSGVRLTAPAGVVRGFRLVLGHSLVNGEDSGVYRCAMFLAAH